MDKHIEELRGIIKYQIEEYGGKLNPKDDFVGFINDILSWKRKYFPKDYIRPNIEKVLAEMKKRYDDDDGTLTFNDRNFMDDVDIEKVIAFIRKVWEGKNGTNP